MKTMMACWTVGLMVVMGSQVTADSTGDLRTDHIMYRDPELRPAGSRLIFDPRLKGLWEQALRQPETELQRMAADTIALAHERGVPDLGSTAASLVQVLQRPETDATVRRAAAHAIVALQAKEHAAALGRVAEQYGLQLQLVIEPALAGWNNPSLRETWRKRIADAGTASRLRLLAIEGLGALRDVESRPALLEIVHNEQAAIDQRLAAARSVVAMSDVGLLDDARRWLADKSPKAIPNRLVGVSLLGAQSDDASLKVLTDLSADPEPSIAAAALDRLWSVDPKHVIPLAPQAIKHSDVNVRRFGARALLVQGDNAAIGSVALLLDDPNPSLRRLVAKGLFDLAAKEDLRKSVIAATEHHLGQQSWRGIEQAALLVGSLKHAAAAPRLLELLPFPRDEVAVSVAWSLRQLRLPETLPPILEYSKRTQPLQWIATTPPHEFARISAQLAQLFQLFGEARYAEADPLLRLYIPKIVGLGESRYAACWALGLIHEGKPVEDLVEQFAERLSDVDSLMPELDPVRMMCALGLGRMKAVATLPTLRHFATQISDQVSLACWWSIQRLTGESPPEWKPSMRTIAGWFLQPLDR